VKRVAKRGLAKNDRVVISAGLMTLSVFAVIAAAWGFFFYDIVLASTQWLLVAAVLALFGLFVRTSS
jgi:hypothetical protein